MLGEDVRQGFPMRSIAEPHSRPPVNSPEQKDIKISAWILDTFRNGGLVMRYFVAAAVYLLVGCAPSSAPQKQTIRPAANPRASQGKIDRDSEKPNRRASNTKRKRTNDSQSVEEQTATTQVMVLDLDAFPKAQALVDDLINRAEQHVPSFANQLKWAFEQELKTPSGWLRKNSQDQAAYAVATALDILNKLDRRERQFCESYRTDLDSCANWPQKNATIPSGTQTNLTSDADLQSKISLANILLANNSETLKAESLKKLLSSISFDAPYLVEQTLKSADILKVAQSLDSKKLKLVQADGLFADDLSKRPVCSFHVTSKALNLKLEDSEGAEKPHELGISLEEIQTDQSINIVRDEQQNLEFVWSFTEGQAIIQAVDSDQAANGFDLNLKDGHLSCR